MPVPGPRRVLLDRLLEPGETRFLAFGLLGAAAVRFAFLALLLAEGRPDPNIDEVMIARNLRDGMGYVFDYYRMFGDAPAPSAFFPPSYVLNVYVIESLFGEDLPIYVQNVLLSLGALVALYFLARRVFGALTARLTFLLGAIYLPFFSRFAHGAPVYYNMLLMTLLLTALHATMSSPSRFRYAATGLLGGLLALSMPDVVFYLAIVAAGVFLVSRGWARLVFPACLAAGALLVVAPWTARNWVSLGEQCLISSNGGFNLYMGNNEGTTHEVNHDTIRALDARLSGALGRADEFERDRILVREAVRYMREHPGRTAANMLRRFVHHWTFRPKMLGAIAGRGNLPRSYAWSYLAFYAPVLVLGAAGVWANRERWRELLPLGATFLYSSLVSMIFVIQTKQRLIKVEPVLLLFAAAFLAQAGLSARGTPRRASP